MEKSLEDLIAQRREKLKALRAEGRDPFQIQFHRTGPIGEILSAFEEGRPFRAAGRLTALRVHGQTAFGDLRDMTGKIQILFSKEELGERFDRIARLDLGDGVGVEGACVTTRTGEKTLKVADWAILVKALKPPPEKWHGLKDRELKARKRYLDLMANPDARALFERRSRIIAGIRRFLDGKGFLEVETPLLQPLPGGAAGRPFTTHHNALNMDLFLRIAPELYLKRLLVGGLERVYELGRNFRNEGLSTRHNPEFTMLEVYEAYGDCDSMMTLTEELVTTLARELHGGEQIPWGKQTLDLKRPWKRVSFAGLLEKKYGLTADASIDALAKGMKMDFPKIPKNQLAKTVLDGLEELFPKSSGAPVFVTDFLKIFSPLAKAKPDNPHIAQRFELFVGGMELANAFTEQNDPVAQRESFQATQALGGEEVQAVDEDFLEALEYGMPPAGGLGIGVDRLVMLLTNQPSIREVLLFPTLRPEGA